MADVTWCRADHVSRETCPMFHVKRAARVTGKVPECGAGAARAGAVWHVGRASCWMGTSVTDDREVVLRRCQSRPNAV